LSNVTVQQAQTRSSWKGPEISKEDFVYDLTQEHLAIFDRVVDGIRARGVTLKDLTEDEFLLSELRDTITAIASEILDGRGLVIVRGWPIDRYSLEEIGILFWAFGKFIGSPVVQNWKGDKLIQVRDLGQVTERGSTSNRELPMHSDMEAVVGLLAIKKAKSGGVSTVASARAVHDYIAQTRPEYLEPLYAGYRFRWRGDKDEQEIVADYAIPAFDRIGEHINAFLIKPYMISSAADPDVPVFGIAKDALDYFEEVAGRPEIAFTFTLEPGEASIMCNYSVLHSRTTFEDWPELERRRLLLRLWLSLPDSRRPVHPNLRRFFVKDAFYGEKTKPNNSSRS
jgi:hypothetical protein